MFGLGCRNEESSTYEGLGGQIGLHWRDFLVVCWGKKAKARSQFIQFLTSGLAPDSAVEMRDTYNTRFADGDLQLVKITITEGWE